MLEQGRGWVGSRFPGRVWGHAGAEVTVGGGGGVVPLCHRHVITLRSARGLPAQRALPTVPSFCCHSPTHPSGSDSKAPPPP